MFDNINYLRQPSIPKAFYHLFYPKNPALSYACFLSSLLNRAFQKLGLLCNTDKPLFFFIGQFVVLNFGLFAEKHYQLFCSAPLEVHHFFNVPLEFLRNGILGCAGAVMFVGFLYVLNNSVHMSSCTTRGLGFYTKVMSGYHSIVKILEGNNHHYTKYQMGKDHLLSDIWK